MALLESRAPEIYMTYTRVSQMGTESSKTTAAALSAAERAYQHIHNQILRGQHASGAFLEEEPLSDEIGVSRTPIREALRRLAAEGFIELIPRRGARVRGVTAQELRQFLEARYALESHAIRTICQQKLAVPAEMARMIGEISRLVLERNFFEAAELDRQFHRAIVCLAGNDLLVELFDALRFRHLLACLSTPPDPTQVRLVVDEHVDLLAALSSHDTARALDNLAEHLDPERAPRLRALSD
ncbi:GntR family transcriptional regulator [Cupriavidus pinatubonensis]|nr:GntR family transcriptional regulator [Cupriavidus pinatubonensis]